MGLAKIEKLYQIFYFFVVIIISGLIFINNQNQIELESVPPGAALVAYSNSVMIVKISVWNISSNYEGTESEFFLIIVR